MAVVLVMALFTLLFRLWRPRRTKPKRRVWPRLGQRIRKARSRKWRRRWLKMAQRRKP